MKKRVISGVVMAVLLAVILVISSKFKIVFALFACLLACGAFKELLDVKKDFKIPIIMKFLGYFGVLAIAASGFKDALFWVGVNCEMLAAIFLMLFVPSVLLHKLEYKVNDAIFLSAITVFVGLVFNLVIGLYLQSLLYLIFVVVVACCTDIFALLGGKLLGKQKFTEISPNKTLEGCVVGTLFSVIISTTFYMTLINDKNLFSVILLTFVLSIIGQIGDLFFSKIKRENGVKDFSNLIPGHGGILDRVDSIIFILIAYLFLIQYI